MEQLGLEALEQRWPSFLDDVDRHPDRAFDGFYRFAQLLLTVRPPSVLRGVPAEERHDLIHDVILHCCDDRFRVLRRYRDQGKPFAAWLSFVSRNKIINLRRREVPLQEVPEHLPEPSASPADQADGRQIVSRVEECLVELSRTCQLLLQGAADGLRPRELTQLLGWPEDRNKKASDDLRACRSRLKKALMGRGITSDVLAGFLSTGGAH